MSKSVWTPGPLAPHAEWRAEHGEYVYLIRETEPKGQIAGFPKAVGKFRRREDAQTHALTPEMAEAILTCVDEDGFILPALQCAEHLRPLAEKLRAVSGEAPL